MDLVATRHKEIKINLLLAKQPSILDNHLEVGSLVVFRDQKPKVKVERAEEASSDSQHPHPTSVSAIKTLHKVETLHFYSSLHSKINLAETREVRVNLIQKAKVWALKHSHFKTWVATSHRKAFLVLHQLNKAKA